MAMLRGRDRSRDGNANTGVYSWLCDRSYRAIGTRVGLGAVTGTLAVLWGHRVVWRALAASYSDVAGNLRWLWQVGGDSWAGPLRWGLAASAAMCGWFLAMGLWEWWRGRQ